jgi:hypothetical protein
MILKMDRSAQDHFDTQTTTLNVIRDSVSEAIILANHTSSLSERIMDSFSGLARLCTQMKEVMSKILSINMATYKMVFALQNSLPTYMERHLISEPFVLEDAMGRISPVHLDFINSWSAFNAVLQARFEGLQGHAQVVNGNWILQDHATGREISQTRIWEGTFLPGVDMSLLFQRETTCTVESFDLPSPAAASNAPSAACPRCQASVAESQDTETQR